MLQVGLESIVKVLCQLLTRSHQIDLYRIEFMFESNKRFRRRDNNGKVLAFQTDKQLYEYIRVNNWEAIHRGPAYFAKEHILEERQDGFLCFEAPLIFDIDAHDFDRTCKCQRKQICNQCWSQHVVSAIDRVIRICNQLGFKKILAFYSGRRGVHVYVTDIAAWTLDVDQKRMIYNRIIEDNTTKLDTAVLFEKGHLTKVPLLPHGSTGNMCMPLVDYHSFNPETDSVHKQWVTPEMIQQWTTQVKNILL
jgi:hypothetical protein